MSAPTPVPNNVLSDRLREFSARFRGDFFARAAKATTPRATCGTA